MTEQPDTDISNILPSALPDTLESAIAQAQTATQAAIAAGYTRLQVELIFPELKPLPVTEQFVSAFAHHGAGLKLFFTDAGTAALAKRDWGDPPFQIRSLDVAGTRQTTPVEEQVDAADQFYLFVAPSAVEVGPVEQICQAANCPIVLLNPRLEDIATIGIGYAGRQLRQRFLDTIEPCYSLRPLDERSALLRCYPSPWQVWVATDGENYQKIAETQERPDSEKLDEIFTEAFGQTKRSGLLSGIQQLMQALGR